MSHSWEGSPEAAQGFPRLSGQRELLWASPVKLSLPRKQRKLFLACEAKNRVPSSPASRLRRVLVLGQGRDGVFVSTGPAVEEPAHSHESQESKSFLGWESWRLEHLERRGSILLLTLWHRS